MVFLQLFVNGLQLGAIYALTAVGFSLIFGSTKIFHVAHGSAFAISGYIYWWLASKLGVPWPIATLAAVVAAAVFGLLMERWIYRPIQRHEASFFTVFIAAFGVQLIIQNLIGTVAGRGMETVNTPLSRSVEVMDGLFIAPIAAISIVVAIAVFYALNYFLTRTHVGIAMRALSENPDLVRVFGLDPGRVAQWAFMIGSAVVVPGAIFTAMTAGLNPAIGTHVMLVSLSCDHRRRHRQRARRRGWRHAARPRRKSRLLEARPAVERGGHVHRAVRVHHLPSIGLLRQPDDREVTRA